MARPQRGCPGGRPIWRPHSQGRRACSGALYLRQRIPYVSLRLVPHQRSAAVHPTEQVRPAARAGSMEAQASSQSVIKVHTGSMDGLMNGPESSLHGQPCMAVSCYNCLSIPICLMRPNTSSFYPLVTTLPLRSALAALPAITGLFTMHWLPCSTGWAGQLLHSPLARCPIQHHNKTTPAFHGCCCCGFCCSCCCCSC